MRSGDDPVFASDRVVDRLGCFADPRGCCPWPVGSEFGSTRDELAVGLSTLYFPRGQPGIAASR